ncbi:hypothetical protein DERF_015027 [Dermatophagoides farinae]|uniref:Uncharacterized protein n=1 Tax=Dermatophagoides farinae TaxID=6954 RepID=A0A922KXU8_DERFA|nr:hypothetical protein DERF_015027 [Dermatophagoides farinae]
MNNGPDRFRFCVNIGRLIHISLGTENNFIVKTTTTTTYSKGIILLHRNINFLHHKKFMAFIIVNE